MRPVASRCWPLSLIALCGCAFIDDFDRFREGRLGDGGSDLADAGASDGATDTDARPGDRDADASTSTSDGQTPSDRDADSTPGDAGTVDAGVPRDDAGSNPPTDAGGSVPAPGCANASVTPTTRCYPDLDGDRFADLTGMEVLACSCPTGTIAVANPASAQGDCWDDPSSNGADAKPGQTSFFSRGYGNGRNRYDYDCDGTETKEHGVIRPEACGGLLGLLCSSIAGFSQETACGAQGDYTQCTGSNLNCQPVASRPTQACK